MCSRAFLSLLSLSTCPTGGDFTEFGGVKGTNHRGMLPTGETAQFIIGGNDLERRLKVQALFDDGHFFYQNDITWLEFVKEGEPLMSWQDHFIPGMGQLPFDRDRDQTQIQSLISRQSWLQQK
jgi:hypothetical protein